MFPKIIYRAVGPQYRGLVEVLELRPGGIIQRNDINDVSIILPTGDYDSEWFGVGLWGGFVEGDYAA